VPRLYEMFHKREPAEDLLTVCRQLRNTVHGAGLSSMVTSTATGKDTLVRLPQTEAVDIVERLNRLAPEDSWGVEARIRNGVYIDPARLAEGLIPHVFSTLEEVLAHTPFDHLAGYWSASQWPTHRWRVRPQHPHPSLPALRPEASHRIGPARSASIWAE